MSDAFFVVWFCLWGGIHMKTIDEYRAGFCDEEKEIVVYISKGFAGASMLQDCYVVKSVFVAMMDPQDGKLTECDGRIEQVVSKDEYEQGEFITIEDNMIVSTDHMAHHALITKLIIH